MRNLLLFTFLLTAKGCYESTAPALAPAAVPSAADEAIAQLLRQQRSECTIWQFSGTDSARSALVCRRLFDARRRLISETYRGFLPTFEDGWVDGASYYFYQDTLLRQRLTIYQNQDRGKTLYSYNPKGQLIKQEHQQFERRLKPTAAKGLGRSGGCITMPEDYEPQRSWASTGQSTFTYDGRGNKVREEFQRPPRPAERNTWTYDAGNRLLRQDYYDGRWLRRTEQYAYTASGYCYTRTWFDLAGQPEHLVGSSTAYRPRYIFAVTGSSAHPLRQVRTDETGQIGSIVTYTYDAQRRRLRVVARDGQGRPLTTHRYVYR